MAASPPSAPVSTRVPGLAAVGGAQDDAAVADGEAEARIGEGDGAQRAVDVGGLHRPVLAAVVRADDGAGGAGGPAVAVVDAHQRQEVGVGGAAARGERDA